MFFRRKVEVTFIDGATGQVIGAAKMPPEQLPESFLAATTMHLGGSDWSVMKADPPTRAEFSRSKRLVLTLARVEHRTVDPRTILYSLPTITDHLPPEADEADGHEELLAEDDWRQIEFVSAAYRFVVEDEIADIEHIHHEQRRDHGFAQLHVRHRVEEPLDGVPIADVRVVVTDQPVPVRFEGHALRVAGGFAHTLPGGWVLYGTEAHGTVGTLALIPAGEVPPRDVIAALDEFARDHRLLLVDWCRCGVGEPGTTSFAAIFA